MRGLLEGEGWSAPDVAWWVHAARPAPLCRRGGGAAHALPQRDRWCARAERAVPSGQRAWARPCRPHHPLPVAGLASPCARSLARQRLGWSSSRTRAGGGACGSRRSSPVLVSSRDTRACGGLCQQNALAGWPSKPWACQARSNRHHRRHGGPRARRWRGTPGSRPVPASNPALERTGHTTGFFPARASVGCGPPLTATVGLHRLFQEE